jgi:hypothetical protein
VHSGFSKNTLQALYVVYKNGEHLVISIQVKILPCSMAMNVINFGGKEEERKGKGN